MQHHTAQGCAVADVNTNGNGRDHSNHQHQHHHHLAGPLSPPPAATTPHHQHTNHPLMCATTSAAGLQHHGHHAKVPSPLSPLGSASEPSPAAAGSNFSASLAAAVDPSTESIRAAWESAGVLHLHAPSRPRFVFVVQAARVHRLPLAPDFGCLMLCPAYDHGLLDASASNDTSTDSAATKTKAAAEPPVDHYQPFCPRGDACPYVHADLTGARRTAPHTMAAAVAGFYEMAAPASNDGGGKAGAAGPSTVPLDTRLLLNKQERHEDAHRYRVGDEGSAAVSPPPSSYTDVHQLASVLARGVPIQHIVTTRAALAPTPTSPHQPVACPHFVTRFRCDRGDRCKFAHVIIGPNGFGATRPTGNNRAVSSPHRQQPPHVVVPELQRDLRSPAGDGATPRSVGGRSTGTSSGSACSRRSPASSAGSSVGRRQHNPYAALPRAVVAAPVCDPQEGDVRFV